MPVPPTRSETEPALLLAARAGCAEAFGELYERYWPLAVSVARRAVGADRSSSAEDVAQTAFVSVFGALRSGRGPVDEFRPYLVTAIRRHAVRSAKGPLPSLLPTVMEELADDRAVGPVALDGTLGGHTMLEEAFAGLPARSQTVLWATEVQGARPADVAAYLDLPADSVYVLRHRARRRLVRSYVATCARAAGDECRIALDQLVRDLRSAPVDATLASPPAHVSDCSQCRDVLRGVDVGVQ